MQKLERSSTEFYLAAGITILSVVLPMTWWLKCIFLLVVAGLWIDLVWRSQLTADWKWKRKAPIIAAGLAVLVATSWRAVRDDYRGAEQPEVTLRFVHPASPMLALDNKSGAIARDVKWAVALWNIDDLRTYVRGSSGNDPLPIPIQTYDVLRPHTSGGFQGIFLDSLNADYIKPGNRLAGSVSVVCPTCSRGHTYVVYITWGKGGWYAEAPQTQKLTEGELLVPKPITKENLEAYFKLIEQIPASQRHPIEVVN
jgi:hypothetical protein